MELKRPNSEKTSGAEPAPLALGSEPHGFVVVNLTQSDQIRIEVALKGITLFGTPHEYTVFIQQCHGSEFLQFTEVGTLVTSGGGNGNLHAVVDKLPNADNVVAYVNGGPLRRFKSVPLPI